MSDDDKEELAMLYQRGGKKPKFTKEQFDMRQRQGGTTLDRTYQIAHKTKPSINREFIVDCKKLLEEFTVGKITLEEFNEGCYLLDVASQELKK